MRSERLLMIVSILGGTLLTVIGVRYFLVPEHAARTFGLPARPAGHELYSIVGLRNVWLGLLAIGMAGLRQWRALALWFALSSVVCFADATIAARALGELAKVAFHAGCGLASVALFWATWRRSQAAG